jgi:hypothetical protein
MNLLLQNARFIAIFAIVYQCIAAPAAWAADGANLRIETRGGAVDFSVEEPVTQTQMERGLMEREHIPEGYGMLFWFGTPRVVTMWMKNTPSPLDMLFINAEGKITHIARNTTPYSLDIITHPTPAVAVLEIAGGSAKRLGIRTNDRIIHSRFTHETPH